MTKAREAQAAAVEESFEGPKALGDSTPLDRIHPWPDNNKARPIKPADVREVARSIKRFGWSAPIVARKANGEIIEGHVRYAAAKRLKMTAVPVRFLDVSEEEAHALALAANKTQRKFDKEGLGDVLELLESLNVDLTDGTGFDEDELDKIMGHDHVTNEVALEEVVDTAPEFWLSVRGPLTVQPEVLKLLHEALGAIDGVIVNLGTTGR